ncbi:Phage late control gene D protein (GPD) [Rhodoferax sp. OV413]|nr:Phage late control gene D protein (GPD) [Rhodoferax sp. OV413]
MGAIALRNQLTARVDAVLAAKAVAHIDQTNESDLNFITRLAQRFDAVATVKKGLLLFLPITGTTISTGKPLPSATIARAKGDSHLYHTSDRVAYRGVRAYWHAPQRAQRRSVLVGLSGNAKRLKESHASEADAHAAAQAEWGRIQRGAATFELTLALGLPQIAPQTPEQVNGFKPEIDGTDWLVVKAGHRVGDGGFTTRLEMERNHAAHQKPAAPYAPSWTL